MTDKCLDILNTAINLFGVDNQLNVAIEEMSELTKEICKTKRGFHNENEVADEMADVYIMLEQLKIIFGNDIVVKERIDYKVSRLNSRIENFKNTKAVCKND